MSPRTLSYREGVREGLREALTADPRVFLMGEDIGAYGGSYAVTLGLIDEFGPARVRDTPLSELAITGVGVGAALGEMRPIVELMTVNFSLLAIDQIVNSAATLLYMSGGQMPVPLVIRMATGAGRRVGAQHSRSLEAWFASVPGLRVVAPASVNDARGMIAAAIADPNPVVIFEHVGLYPMEEEVPEGIEAVVDLEGAAVRRGGRDVTLVAYGGTVPTCLRAATDVAEQGVEAEVVDLRSLRPLDLTTVKASVARTHRLVVVEEACRTLGVGAEISARVAEEALDELDAPVVRIAAADVPLPYAGHLEDLAIPQVDDVVGAVVGVRARTRAANRPRSGRPRGATHQLRMPALGPETPGAKVIQYGVHLGDVVRRGDRFAWIETTKGVMEIEAFSEGMVTEVLVPPGETVDTGTALLSLEALPEDLARASQGSGPAAA